MKTSFPTLSLIACCSSLLTGCAFLGYHKHEKARWAPPEEAAAVQFPDAYEGGLLLTGPMMAALKVAMDEYRPPGIKPEDQETPAARCLADWKYIKTRVIQVNEDFFFVQFLPDLSNCGPGFIVVDSGAVYAIDGKGRILSRK
jgi:hypothetical protein